MLIVTTVSEVRITFPTGMAGRATASQPVASTPPESYPSIIP